MQYLNHGEIKNKADESLFKDHDELTLKISQVIDEFTKGKEANVNYIEEVVIRSLFSCVFHVGADMAEQVCKSGISLNDKKSFVISLIRKFGLLYTWMLEMFFKKLLLSIFK